MQYLPLHVRVHPCVVERDGCAICSDTPRITRPLSQRLHHTYSNMGSVRPSGHRTRRSSRSKEIKPYKDYLLPLGGARARTPTHVDGTERCKSREKLGLNEMNEQYWYGMVLTA